MREQNPGVEMIRTGAGISNKIGAGEAARRNENRDEKQSEKKEEKKKEYPKAKLPKLVISKFEGAALD